MRLPLTLSLALLFLVSTGTAANAESAQDFLAGCRTVADAPTTDDHVSFEGLAAHRCWGAFAVLQEIVRWGNPDQTRLLGVCPPAQSTRTQLVAVFVEYLNRHPERRHEDFVKVALDALSAVFPCR